MKIEMRADTTCLEHEQLALLIANDLAALLTRELPAQSDALLALVTEIESSSISWVNAWAKGAK